MVISQAANAYTVTNLKAAYHNGQVFLTWTSVNATNLQYNVYRSTMQITQSSQLTTSSFLGFVRDSSGKNIRLSQLTATPQYYCITDGGTPLAANQGLYVATSTSNQSWYYAVTVTTLSDIIEDKTIVSGQNSLTTAVNETVSKPAPVFQNSTMWVNGETVDRYVQFVNNQEAERLVTV